MNHKTWLHNEYTLWIKALQESTVDSFGSNEMVRRMLGEVNPHDYYALMEVVSEPAWDHLFDIQKIGGEFKGIIARMIYYGQKVLKCNPTAICEIGGGVGQFYAVLRALGYKGTYYIFDLKEVREFQRKFLDEVTKRTGLDTMIDYQKDFDYCVSFYCLGELDDETKKWYVENVVKYCPHGLIVWNPHSQASDKIEFNCKQEPEFPLTSPGNKVLTW